MDLISQEEGTTALVSDDEDPPQDGPSTTKASDDIIDLEQGQFASDTQAQAVDVINGLEPQVPFQHHQEHSPPSATQVGVTQALGATQVPSSQHLPIDGPAATMDSTNKVSSSHDDFIDLEEGQFLSEPDANSEQTQAAVDMINGVEPLASSDHQPQDGPSTVDTTKASIHVIDLEQGLVTSEEAVAQAQQGDLKLQAEPLVVNGVEPLVSSAHQPEDIPGAADGTKASVDGIIDLEEGQVEDMDLSDDDVVDLKHQPPHAPVQAQTTVPAALQTIHGVSALIDKGDNAPPGTVTPVHASRSAFIDESPTRGVKRPRVESAEPSVRVVYSNLTRESKRRLMELMQQWSEWQARKQHSFTESVEEIFECGEETYYPALHVGSERYAVSFCVDYQARENVAVDDGAVPLYNREFTLGSSPMGDSANTESKKDNDDSRCFNCGSYSHALKDCSKPRDHVAISNARKQHNLKKNLSNVNRQNRYYQKTPGKFDDLKAGVLGSETRECLGLRENDPPPWLHRMRELGYPPGYLDEVEDEDKPSGITIFGDGEVKTDHEEGELPEKGAASPPRKKMTVEFPGINAPVPEKGDPWLWGSTPPQSSSGRHHHPSSDSRDRGLVVNPGAEHYSSSRYHPYDHGGPATPGLVRSHSDRERRSSSSYYENPPPPPGEVGAWTPHAYSSRQHSSRDRERERERDRHYYSSSSSRR